MRLVDRDLAKPSPDGARAPGGVSLTVPRGMFALLGPDGAGKSTLMRTLATPQRPDTGRIHLTRPEGTRLDVLRGPGRLRQALGYPCTLAGHVAAAAAPPVPAVAG